jgi:hypothetical protein
MTRDELLAAYASGQRDFSRANLREAELYGADLREADLREANLPDGYRWASTQQWTILAMPDGIVEVGCQKHQAAHWIEHVDSIGQENHATPLTIAIVRAFCGQIMKEREAKPA